jgi:hypothetical protein
VSPLQVFNEAAEALATHQIEYDQIYPHPVSWQCRECEVRA